LSILTSLAVLKPWLTFSLKGYVNTTHARGSAPGSEGVVPRLVLIIIRPDAVWNGRNPQWPAGAVEEAGNIDTAQDGSCGESERRADWAVRGVEFRWGSVTMTVYSGGQAMKLPGNLKQMMEQAQKMQEALQQEIAAIRADASIGGGVVTVSMDGRKNVLDLKIDPEIAGDLESLRDLILSALREASRKVDEEIQSKVGDRLGGMGLPPGLL
jgi:nucleoid-associated protein EbfC